MNLVPMIMSVNLDLLLYIKLGLSYSISRYNVPLELTSEF
jgi:hypothetical protein